MRFISRSVAQPAEKYGLTNQRIDRRSRKSRDALRRLEEVERVAGRRRVDDDQVVAPAGVQLATSCSTAMYSCDPAKLCDRCW